MLLSIFPAVVFAADKVEINETNFPDSAFRDYVTENFDKDENGKLSDTEIAGVTALTYLSCSNNQLTSLDLSNNTALTKLSCSNNQLTSLDLSKNTLLTFF